MCEGNTRTERLDNAIKQVTSNKEAAREFLYNAGITTKRGDLRAMFR